MKLSQGLSKAGPTAMMFAFYAVAFACNAMALKKLDLSVTYAIWSGLGTAAVAVIGMTWFQEEISAQRLISIALIICGHAARHFRRFRGVGFRNLRDYGCHCSGAIRFQTGSPLHRARRILFRPFAGDDIRQPHIAHSVISTTASHLHHLELGGMLRVIFRRVDRIRTSPTFHYGGKHETRCEAHRVGE
jgi:multidrug transporter EmrE-like cation transporter